MFSLRDHSFPSLYKCQLAYRPVGTFLFSDFYPFYGLKYKSCQGRVSPCRKEITMLKIIATTAVVSKGFDGNPAVRFSENGDSVRFRIGSKVYDTRATILSGIERFISTSRFFLEVLFLFEPI